ncbi:hypothetical protein IPG36_00085 [bacterium]|nr:MAG: hypothetical protein IPG36_00085 [bacterium]
MRVARTKGATNKEKPSAALNLSAEERVSLLANIILDIITEERAKQ